MGAAVHYSPHYELVVSGDGVIKVFKVSSGEPVSWLNALKISYSQIAFSDDDKNVLVFDASGVSNRSVDSGDITWHVPISDSLKNRDVAWVTGEKYFVTGSWVYTSSVNVGGFSVWGSTKVAPAQLWDARTGREVKWLAGLNIGFPIVVPVMPDRLLTLADGEMQLRNAETGAVLTTFENGDAASHVAFSQDAHYLAAAVGGKGMLWDVRTGRLLRAAEREQDGSVSIMALSSDKLSLVFAVQSHIFIWDLKIGKEIARASYDMPVTELGVSANGARIAVRTQDPWNYATDRIFIHRRSGERELEIPGHFKGPMSFSSDGRLLYSNSNWPFCWDLEKHRSCVDIGSESDEMALSSSEKLLAYSREDRVEIVDPKTRHRVGGFHVPYLVSKLWFAANDDRFVGITLIGREDKAQWYDRTTGRPAGAERVGIEADAAAAAADNRLSPELPGFAKPILTGSVRLKAGEHGTLYIVGNSDEKKLGELRSFPHGAWAVTDDDGRFDTDLDRATEMFWQLDTKAELLPLEMYMRDYFEPRLLPRLVAGERLRPAVPVDHLSTVRPNLQIVSVKPVDRDMVEVAVKILPGVASEPQRSVHDVRLFRDGQLVARYPAPDPEGLAACRHMEGIARWRCETEIAVGQRAKPIQFRTRIPIFASAQEVEFSVYAFNEDRVKSRTERSRFGRPKDWLRTPARSARILAIGVASNTNLLHFGLTHPEKDARDFAAALDARLGDFPTAHDVVLLTDPNGVEPTAGLPTKSAIRSQLRALATRAASEDLVVVYFSGHGVRDKNGMFYMIPEDMPLGDPKVDLDALLPRAISSTELASWLSEIDAGQLVLVIDACHSGALTGGTEFKPGPMGEATFGQLAYDKSMQILSATQPQALATTATRAHSLLTDVLIRDCFPSRAASRHNQVSLGNALKCAVDRVPRRQVAEGGGKTPDDLQVPSIFDYGHRQLDVLLKQ
jgi:WD40 repeat protein